MNQPPRVFISYSHADEAWKDKLKKYLDVQVKLNKLIVWDDRKIRTGEKWNPAIEKAILESDIAILLVTVDFLTSTFIQDEEIPFILKNELKIMPLIISPCAWTDFAYISEPQGFTKNNQPLEELEEVAIKRELTRISQELCGFNVELIPFSKQKESFSDSVDASIFNLLEEEFMQCAEKYIGNRAYLSKVESESTVPNMIKTLYDSSQKEDLASILHDLSTKIEFDISLQQWVEKHYNPNNKQIVREKESLKREEKDRIYVIMRHIEASKYEVTISPRYSKGGSNQRNFILEDISSKECQSNFIVQFRGLRPHISIHLIVSEELYLQNIRLWAKRNRNLLDLANPLYLHTLERFNYDSDDYRWMIEDWKNIFVSDYTLSKSLSLLDSNCCRYNGKDENDNSLLGVCYEYQPTDIDEICDILDIAFVSLWSHKTQTEYHQKVIDNFDKITIGELPQKVKKCEHLSLLWDDMRMLEDFKRELE